MIRRFGILLVLISFLIPLPKYDVCIKLGSNTQCENTYQWFLKNNSFYRIDFSQNSFPLYGFNNLNFNLLGEGSDKRFFLPFEIIVKLPTNSQLTKVISEPEAAVDYENNVVDYKSDNDPYRNRLIIYTSNQSDLRWLNPVNYLASLALLYLGLALISYSYTPYLVAYLKISSYTDKFLHLCLLLLAVKGNFLPFEIALFTYLHFSRSRQKIAILISAIIVFSIYASNNLGCYNCQNILHPSSDPLSYESMARDIYLKGQIFLAGESGPFHISPLYRYFLALSHLLAGESLWSVRFFGVLIMFYLYYVLYKIFSILFNRNYAYLSILFLALLDKLPQLGLLFLFKEYYSESIALPALFISIYLILSHKSKSFLAGLFFGIAIATRNNYLPALLPLLVYIYFKKSKYDLLKYVTGVVIFPAFIVLRNFIVTGQPLLFVTSTAASLQLDLYARFYHGQRETSPLTVFAKIFNLLLSDPPSVLIPIWKNILTMTGLIGLIKFSQIYFPIWILGLPGICITLVKNRKPELLCYLSILILLVLFHLPFGLHNSGSAKYLPFIILLTPFSVVSFDLFFKYARKRIVG